MTQELLDYFNGDELAASTWLKKYALEGEKTPADMHKRIAKELARIETKYPNSISEQEIFSYLDHFKYIIPGGSIMSSLGNSKFCSLSNCTVLPPPEDSVVSILDTAKDMANLMKRRAGVGFNLNKLRPEGAKVSNASKTSTGAVSFMDIYSNVTETIAMNGRRGALLLSMSINHPDILSFITKKQDLTKVTGANVSVQLNKEFMKVVDSEDDYILRFPIDIKIPNNLPIENMVYNELFEFQGNYFKKIKAKELWKDLITCAYKTGEPGVLFEDNIANLSPENNYNKFKFVGSNPCVTADTTLLTSNGFVKIGDVVGKEITIWNGWEWSTLTPFKTSDNAEVFLIKFSDGSELKCTSYHKFILSDNSRKELKDLNIGDKLIKWNLPQIKIEDNFDENLIKQYYTQGFWQGDGSIVKENKYLIYLYNEKQSLIPYLSCIPYNKEVDNDKRTTALIKCSIINKKNYVPFEINNIYKLAWLAGIIDSDGSINEESGSINISSVDKSFLQDIQKLLILLGIKSKVLNEKEAEIKKIKGQLCNCQNSYRLLISASKVKILRDLGFKNYRVNSNPNPQRDSEHFVKIESIEKAGFEATYCVNEEKNHSCLFNSVVTANCGEQLLGAYDACRLIHINLSSFVINPFTEDSFFDFNYLDTICRKIVRLGDDIVDLELESILKILNKTFEEKNTEEYNLWNNFYKICEKGRRIGIGFTGLADVFAMLNLKYGSEESLQLAEKISEFMFYSELDESIELAKERGKFPDFDLRYENTNWHLSLKERNIDLYNKMLKYGRRNLSFSTVAPTGTVSLMARTSSGIEPVFMNYYKRRRKCSSKEDKVDFIDIKGEKFTEFLIIHPKFEQWCKIKNSNVDLSDEKYLDKLYKDSPYYGATALEIDWKFKTELVGKIQKNITNAISNTTNLPENIILEDVYDVYKKAWEYGCKGLTIYRTNSRNGVLVERDKSKKPENLERKGAPKRPDILPSDLYVVTARGEQFIVVVGLYENKPYEIFVYRPNEKVNYTNHFGFITKIKKGVYKFKSDKITIPNLLDSKISLEESANTLYTSILLRHGVELKFIIKTAKKVDDQIVSFSSAMCRILNKYIKETEILEEKCPECGNSLIKTGGCIECKNCGYSKCG